MTPCWVMGAETAEQLHDVQLWNGMAWLQRDGDCADMDTYLRGVCCRLALAKE